MSHIGLVAQKLLLLPLLTLIILVVLIGHFGISAQLPLAAKND
jgi:hypothetical protein